MAISLGVLLIRVRIVLTIDKERWRRIVRGVGRSFRITGRGTRIIVRILSHIWLSGVRSVRGWSRNEFAGLGFPVLGVGVVDHTCFMVCVF